jgi:hypothetical protein
MAPGWSNLQFGLCAAGNWARVVVVDHVIADPAATTITTFTCYRLTAAVACQRR